MVQISLWFSSQGVPRSFLKNHSVHAFCSGWLAETEKVKVLLLTAAPPSGCFFFIALGAKRAMRSAEDIVDRKENNEEGAEGKEERSRMQKAETQKGRHNASVERLLFSLVASDLQFSEQ